jgi:hypothetical protein
MTWKIALLSLAAGALVWGVLAAENAADKSHKLQSVSIRKMADSLHAVIAADRQAYVELLGQQLETDAPGPKAAGNQRERPGLPGHARMLRQAAASIQQKGAEFSYTLRSLWPIDPSNGPQTQVEEAGLQAVVQRPEQPFYSEEELGGRSYFTAIYADRATLASCVDCHNGHPRSPKANFKKGDVMGAIVVRVPLEF